MNGDACGPAKATMDAMFGPELKPWMALMEKCAAIKVRMLMLAPSGESVREIGLGVRDTHA